MGRKDIFELAFDKEITLKEVEDSEILLDLIRLFKIDRRSSAMLNTCCNIKEDMISIPKARDFLR